MCPEKREVEHRPSEVSGSYTWLIIRERLLRWPQKSVFLKGPHRLQTAGLGNRCRELGILPSSSVLCGGRGTSQTYANNAAVGKPALSECGLCFCVMAEDAASGDVEDFFLILRTVSCLQ